jgi:FecR protein
MTERRIRRARVLRITAIAAMTALASICLAATTPQVVGIASAVLNDVRIRPANVRQPHHAAVRERVALADYVETGQLSQLQVLLLDRSAFIVGANARLTIDRYVYDPAGDRALGATIAKGAFRFMSGGADRGGQSSINTPIATLGIRGTIVDGIVGDDAVAIARFETAIDQNITSDPENASLIVLRGPGRRTQGSAIAGVVSVTASGETVVLDRPMLAAYVPAPGMAPIGPFFISRDGLSRINALLFPAVAARRASREHADRPGFQFHMGLPLPMFGGQGPAPQGPQRRQSPQEPRPDASQPRPRPGAAEPEPTPNAAEPEPRGDR